VTDQKKTYSRAGTGEVTELEDSGAFVGLSEYLEESGWWKATDTLGTVEMFETCDEACRWLVRVYRNEQEEPEGGESC
jgi:hypothetical protein